MELPLLLPFVPPIPFRTSSGTPFATLLSFVTCVCVCVCVYSVVEEEEYRGRDGEGKAISDGLEQCL